jgi:hypothetical protein
MRNSLRVLAATAGALGVIALGSAAASASTRPVIRYPAPGSYHQVTPVQDRACFLPGYPGRFLPQPDHYLYPGCYPQPVRDPRPVSELRRVNAWESFTITQHGSSPVQPAVASGLLVSGPGYFIQAGRTETGYFGGATFTVVTAGGSTGTFQVTGGTGRFEGLSGSGTYQVRPSGPRSRRGETITAEGTFSQLTDYGHLL